MSPSLLNASPFVQRILRWGGSGLALAGFVFVMFRLHSYWIDLDFSRIGQPVWVLIVVLVFTYGSANVLLALGWWHLLRHLGSVLPRIRSIKIYGTSQLAKYVPGNIFHLAGRQALGMAEGVSSSVLVKSSILELGLIGIAGSLFGWLILPIGVPSCPEFASTLLLLGSATLIVVFLRIKLGYQTVCTFLWQILFLVISGAVFVILLIAIADGAELIIRNGMIIGGAYIFAWLVGLVTPGAPAGVGVREMILLILLKGFVSETDLIVTVLISRLVTACGDLLFFLASFAISAAPYALGKTNAYK